MTNVPAIQWTSTGVILPSEADILAGVIADINAAFGGQLNPALNTPQGQLATTFAAIIADKNSQIAHVANMIDPTYADGRFQDAIGNLYFMTRTPAQSTVVNAVCVGLTGATVPLGALARDVNGNIYTCTQSGVIGVGGSVTLPFKNIVAGAIACTANTLTTIYQAVTGWESVNNPTDGVTGSEVESRIAFEARRKASVTANSSGSMQAIYAAVSGLSGVLDCYVYENNTATAITVGATAFSIAKNSIYVAAVGGTSQAVAEAIWGKKSLGCDYVGNTTVTVTDPSGYNVPYPAYTVKFQRPTSVPVKFAVQLQNNANLPSDIINLTKNAIIAAFNGTDGGLRARIGSQIVSGRFYAGIAATSPFANILSILLGTSTATLTSVTMGIDQEPTISASDITVAMV
jgi:uncharacterized phage protein gp47/JayE